MIATQLIMAALIAAFSPATRGTMVELLGNVGGHPNIVTLDYSGSNTSGYDVTTRTVPNTIATEIQSQRNNGVAATRLDVAGHSMGGVITKWYVSDLGNITNVPRRNSFPPLNWPGSSYPYH